MPMFSENKTKNFNMNVKKKEMEKVKSSKIT
jgi:hypothetical protein